MTIETQKYEECLIEIKRRLDVISDFVARRKTTGFVITDIELVSIQFRKVIELIAFSSLVANKAEYSKQYAQFEKHWNARFMFRDLKRINGQFFPKPSNRIEKRGNDGTPYTDIETITEGFLTEDDAIDLYEDCSRVLHSNNPYRQQIDIKAFHEKFPAYLNKLSTLLAHHSIVLQGTERNHIIIGVISAAEGFVQVSQGYQLTGDDESKAKEIMD